MTDKRDLFQRYLSGDCSNEEKQMLEDWYANYLKNTASKDVDWDTIAKRNIDAIPSVAITRRKNLTKPILQIAASVVLIASIALIAYRYIRSDVPHHSLNELATVYPKTDAGYLQLNGQVYPIDTTQHNIKIDLAKIHLENSESSLKTIPYTSGEISIKSPLSQNLNLQLPDGSTIILNSGSELFVPKEFSETNRTVKLDGEGFFNISKRSDKNVSFVVEFDQHKVEVLGTSFNIDAQRSRNELKVSLFTGKVRLTKGPSETFLTPGDSYQFNKASGEAQILRQKQLDHDRDWINDVFIFESESIQEVVTLLSSWYNIEIELDPSVDPKESFTGILSRKKNLQQLLETINSNNQYRYQINMKERRITVQKS